MEEREKVVCLAKLAEQAERYDGKGSHPPVAPCLVDVCLQWRRSWRPALWGNPCSVLCPKGIGRRWPSIRRGCISVWLTCFKSEQQPAGRRRDFFWGFLPCWSKNPLNVQWFNRWIPTVMIPGEFQGHFVDFGGAGLIVSITAGARRVPLR